MSTCAQEASKLESKNRKDWPVITNKVINVVIWNRKIFQNISLYYFFPSWEVAMVWCLSRVPQLNSVVNHIHYDMKMLGLFFKRVLVSMSICFITVCRHSYPQFQFQLVQKTFEAYTYTMPVVKAFAFGVFHCSTASISLENKTEPYPRAQYPFYSDTEMV